MLSFHYPNLTIIFLIIIMHGWTEKWMDACIDEQSQIDWCKDTWTDGRMNKCLTNSSKRITLAIRYKTMVCEWKVNK